LNKYKIEFNKHTVFEAYIMLLKKGIYYTLSYYENKLKRVPVEGVYTHIKPGYQKLVNLLKTIESSSKEYMVEIKVGEGSIDNGEYWGTFIDYFLKDTHYDKLFQDLINETAFSFCPNINYNVLITKIKKDNYDLYNRICR